MAGMVSVWEENMVRKFFGLCALLLCIGLSTSARANYTTDPNPITCPDSDIWSWPMADEFPLATINNGDGTEWWFGQYVESYNSGGWQMGIFKQLNVIGVGLSTTCYNVAPQGAGLDGWYLGWVIDWEQGVSFKTFDGSNFASSDKGVTWTKSTCAESGSGLYCAAAPTTTTSCYQHVVGLSWQPLTCASGQYCHFNGYVQGHASGTCYTPCKFVAGHDDCGCVVKVQPDTSGGCPTGWKIETTDGECILPGADSTCYGY